MEGDTNAFRVVSGRAAGIKESAKSNVWSYLLWRPCVTKGADGCSYAA